MYLVVFRSRKRADIDQLAYAAQAEAIETLAGRQEGFLSFNSYTPDDGETVAISEWTDETSARAWGRVADHAAAQADGQTRWYCEYTLFGCENPRIRRFP